MTDKHRNNLERLEKIIVKTKRVLTLDFLGYQSIVKLKSHLKSEESVIISGSTCTPHRISDSEIYWTTNCPIGAYFGSHFHEWNEKIEMIRGYAEVKTYIGLEVYDVISLKAGDVITIERGIAHDFRNVGDCDLECKVTHYK